MNPRQIDRTSPARTASRSNARPSIDAKRRQTIVAAALACAIPSHAFPIVARPGHANEAAATDDDVAMAITFLQERYSQKLPVVFQPISLLQRQFRLGYGRAMDLAIKIERIGFWQIHEPRPQQRVARLNTAFSRDCTYSSR